LVNKSEQLKAFPAYAQHIAALGKRKAINSRHFPHFWMPDKHTFLIKKVACSDLILHSKVRYHYAIRVLMEHEHGKFKNVNL